MQGGQVAPCEDDSDQKDAGGGDEGGEGGGGEFAKYMIPDGTYIYVYIYI